MTKVIAIDYGKKRCGIAVTDDACIIATGLTTVSSHELLSFLKDYFSKNSVSTIVLGDPKRMDGSPTDTTGDVHKLKTTLEQTFEQKVVLVDERFTSKMAMQSMITSGVKKKDRRRKELVDEVSATIILQSYLEGKS